jgi:hypothetical protein
MKIVVIVLALVGLTACNNQAEPSPPSTKVVDSALKTAPDTIKAISVDSVKR